MANTRTPGPSRIGKTLGAILSTPRRGVADEDAAADVEAQEAAPTLLTGEPELAPTAPPPTVPIAVLLPATAPGPESAPAGEEKRPTKGEPSTTALDLTSEVAGDEDVTDPHNGGRRKKRETFLVPEDLADAMRNAIVHLSGPPLYYTLAEFGEHAIRSYIALLEREHNGGRPFPPRPRAVRQGRPLR